MYGVVRNNNGFYDVVCYVDKNSWEVVASFPMKSTAFMFINYLNGGPGDRADYFAKLDLSGK